MSNPLADLSVDVLKKSLAGNHLPTYGTKEQMVARLLSGVEKKKPGPKPKGEGVVIPKKRKATSSLPEAPIDPKELAFYASERPRLTASGIRGYQDQNNELRRRWELIKNAKSSVASVATLATAPDNSIKLSAQLDAAQLQSSNLELNSIEINSSGASVFVYVPKGTASPPLSPDKKLAAAATAKAKAAAKPKAAPKRDDDCGDDECMERWACEVAAFRLAKKLKKATLVAMAIDFGVPHSGSRIDLAEELATQLVYETDTDDESDDEKDDNDDDDK